MNGYRPTVADLQALAAGLGDPDPLMVLGVPMKAGRAR